MRFQNSSISFSVSLTSSVIFFSVSLSNSSIKNLMIKNQRLHTQWDNASVHERCAHVNVIAFCQANLVNDKQRSVRRKPFQRLAQCLGVISFNDNNEWPFGRHTFREFP